MFSDHRVATVEEYLRKLSGQEKEPLGGCDHNYVKPWHAHSDSHRIKPAKLLFMNGVHKPQSTYIYPDEEIDVVNVPSSEVLVPPPVFENQKTKVLANELERSLRCNLNIDDDNTELDDFPIEEESFQKRKMYREIMELINAEILTKAVYSGQPHELIKRKITTERCAKELRNIFANAFYDFDTILWIHRLILDKGNHLSISSYLNILQALSSKIPSIVDRILKSYSGPLGYEYLCQVLKKQWDPILPVLNKNKLRKLPGNPFLIMNCAGFNAKAADKQSRFNFWTAHLNALCKTLYIPMDYENKSTYEEVLDGAILTLTKKISESKNHFPRRPVILAGWNIGALISCYVALEAAVDAVVCFGFPFTGVNGSRGDLNDPLLDTNVPTLFVIGQNSNMCSTDEIEDFRSRMKVETGLIIVGGTDDFLRMSPQKMLLESITQEIVDRCILEEVSEFLHSTLIKMPISERGFVSSRHMVDIEEFYHKDQYRQKRKNPRQYSPEKSPRKHMKMPKEATDVSVKSNTTSSHKKSQQDIPKKVKSSPVKAEEKRSPIKKLRIKIPKPPVQESKSKTKMPKEKTELSKLAFNTYFSENPDAVVSTRKSEISFAKNILPKKDETVDVEKAFGNDCSFLPRPLTPPDLDEPILPEEQKMESEFTEPLFTSPEDVSNSVSISSLGPEIISANMDSSIPSSEVLPKSILESTAVSPSLVNPTLNLVSSASLVKPTLNAVSSASLVKPTLNAVSSASLVKPTLNAVSSASLVKPTLNAVSSASLVNPTLNVVSDSNKGVSILAVPPKFTTEVIEEKTLPSKPVAALNTSIEKPLPPSTQATSSGSTKSIITVPSQAATLLVSGQTYKISSGKFLQLLSKGPVSIKPKNTVIPGLVKPSESTSKVLGTKIIVSEHQANVPKKVETNTSATYVKLASPNITQNVKSLLDLKPSQMSSVPMRMDTPAELAEKRLAIQALNNTLQREPGTLTAKVNEEPSYSICYTKPDGSVIARKVIRPPIRTTVRPHTSLL